MSYHGFWKTDDYLTFACNTHDPDTGVATDADGIPQPWLDQARQLDVLFTCKSVGSNVVDSLGDLWNVAPGFTTGHFF
jgi:hypothetical protein